MKLVLMQNPYEAIYSAKQVAILGGARIDASPNTDTLPERLRQMAHYLTENQTTGADAMFVMDLHDAVKTIERAERQKL